MRALGPSGAPTHRDKPRTSLLAPSEFSLSPLVSDPKPKAIFKWIEVFIIMQQNKPILNATGCNQGVDCFSNGYAMTSQDAEIASGLNGYFCVNNVYGLKGGEELLGFVEIPIVLKTLKDFRQDQVTNQQRFTTEQAI
jgi:hypothetical protein